MIGEFRVVCTRLILCSVALLTVSLNFVEGVHLEACNWWSVEISFRSEQMCSSLAAFFTKITHTFFHLQLPPVELAKDGFAFQAKCWPQIIKHCVLLKQVFRQQSDTTLMTILDEARVGELSNKSAQVLRRHGTLPSAAFGSSNSDTKVTPTLLECKNKNVDQANEREIAKLKGDVHTFNSKDRAINETYRGQLKHCQAPAQLDLKVGAQVLLLKNIDLEKGLANGSRGVVVRFQPPQNKAEVSAGFKNMDLPVVRFDSVKGKEGMADEDREFTILPEGKMMLHLSFALYAQ